MPTPKTYGETLTITEAAEYMGRSRDWFYRQVLPSVEVRWVGGRRYVVKRSLDSFIAGDAA